MRISYENYVDNATLQADTEATGYPIENVQDQRLGTLWKSTDGSTQSIIIDLGERKQVDLVALMAHNFTSDSVVTIEGSDSILMNGSAMRWAEPFNPTQTTAETITYNADMMLKFITSAERRYWRLKGNVGTRVAIEGAYSVVWSPELSMFIAPYYSTSSEIATSVDGYTWTKRSIGVAVTNLVACAWSPALGLFAIGAYDGSNRIITSPDGITWTVRNTSEDNNIRSMCWSPELNMFCAVAASGTDRVIISYDGITWTHKTASEANDWASICWSPQLNLFCAVSANGTNRVMTSPDGIIWTARSASEANSWYGICWSPELSLFCAVSVDGTNRVMTSPDGITWTARSASGAYQWYSVCWSKELSLFVAIGQSGTKIMYSSDGINWSSAGLSGIEANSWRSICWSRELRIFVAVSSDGTNRIMTSTDGITWTAQSGVGTGIQLGRLWLGTYITIDPSSLLDFKVAKKRSDIVIYGKDRQKFGVPGVGWRRIELSFPKTANAMIETVRTMIRHVGKSKSMIFLNFDTDRSYRLVEPLYCSLTDDVSFSHVNRQHYSYSISLEEDC